MRKLIALLTALILMGSVVAFAGGDKNQHRHDGEKGKGQTRQVRINK